MSITLVKIKTLKTLQSPIVGTSIRDLQNTFGCQNYKSRMIIFEIFALTGLQVDEKNQFYDKINFMIK